MRVVHRWLCRLLLVAAAGACALPARAAMSPGTTWSDEAGFLSRMIPENFFTQVNPTLDNGNIYVDTDTGYGYTVGISRGIARLTFTYPPDGPAPTGVGGFFGANTLLTFVFSNGTSVKVNTDATTGFGGYTTDVDPSILTIRTLSFSAANLPTELHVGLDAPIIPEPSTVLAGGLLLLPIAAATIRRLRKDI